LTCLQSCLTTLTIMYAWLRLLLLGFCEREAYCLLCARASSLSLHYRRTVDLSLAQRAQPRMVDTSLVADALSVTSESLNAELALAKPHFFEGFSTLWSDVWNVLLISSLGLAGAYVTQGTEVVTPRPRSTARSQQRVLRNPSSKRRATSDESLRL